MKTTPQTNPATTPAAAPAKPTPAFVNSLNQLFDTTFSDLAIEECELGSLARRILRMRRDKAPVGEISQLVEPLFKSIVSSVLTEESILEASGLAFVPIKQTPQLKALLRKLRKSAA